MAEIFQSVFGKKSKKAKCTVDIEFDKDSWEVGESVTGNILLAKDAPTAVNGVKIRVLGHEWYKVTDSYDVPENKRSKSKVIFDTQVMTISSSKTKENAGETRYPFKVKLPNDISPTSLLTDIAKIHYELQTEVLQSKTSLVESKELFIVKANTNEPVAAFVEKKTFFMKDPIVLRCVPDKRGYQPGDSIHLDLSVDNRSPKEITRIFIRLILKLKYGNNKETKTYITHEITKPKLPILSGQKYEEMILVDKIPETIPASSSSQNVKIEYILTITTEFFSGGEWEAKMPITILGSPPIPIDKEEINYSQKGGGEVIIITPEVSDSNPDVNVPNEPFTSVNANHVPISFDFSDQSAPVIRGGYPYGHPAYYGATVIYKPSAISIFMPKKTEPTVECKQNETSIHQNSS